MSTQPTAPAAPEAAAAAAGLSVDYYALGQNITLNAGFEQIAELLLGVQDGLAATGQVSGLIYAVIRCEADDRGVSFDELTAGLSQDKGE